MSICIEIVIPRFPMFKMTMINIVFDVQDGVRTKYQILEQLKHI